MDKTSGASHVVERQARERFDFTGVSQTGETWGGMKNNLVNVLHMQGRSNENASWKIYETIEI
jgi:hypothetical protein